MKPQPTTHVEFPIGGLTAKRPVADTSIPFQVISVKAMPQEKLIAVFGAAMRQKGGEEQLEQILKVVDGRIKKIRIDPAPDGNQLIVDVGLSELIPLTQVGQAVNRLVAIFSQLIGERAKICIIDEIENGLHHSALQEVWTGIAEAAEVLDVQIFATTHSYECIEAADSAIQKRADYDFSVVRLFRVENAVQGDVLDRKHIEAALAGNIDLRGY
jgi:hypothetical protein